MTTLSSNDFKSNSNSNHRSGNGVFAMFSRRMRILTIMGPTTLPNKHHAMLLMWALLLLQVVYAITTLTEHFCPMINVIQGMIVITLLFGVFYLVDLQRPRGGEPYASREIRGSLDGGSPGAAPVNISCPPGSNPADDLHPLEKSVPLYVITATYPRMEQLAELTRLGQTLKHVKNLYWIVADDAAVPTKQGKNLRVFTIFSIK